MTCACPTSCIRSCACPTSCIHSCACRVYQYILPRADYNNTQTYSLNLPTYKPIRLLGLGYIKPFFTPGIATCCCLPVFSSLLFSLPAASACSCLGFSISYSMAIFSLLCHPLRSRKGASPSFTEKNMGPKSASQCGSTSLTHCIYSLVVRTSSW